MPTVGADGNGVAELTTQVDQLKQQLEEARRTAERQAAPFRQGTPKKRPKKLGLLG